LPYIFVPIPKFVPNAPLEKPLLSGLKDC